MPPTSPYEWLEQRNKRLVQVLDENISVSEFIMGLLETLDQYCDDKGIEYKDLILEKPHIDQDEYVRTRLTSRFSL